MKKNICFIQEIFSNHTYKYRKLPFKNTVKGPDGTVPILMTHRGLLDEKLRKKLQ